MNNAANNVLGIRLRRPNGFKFSVLGGKEGLFLPSTTFEETSPLLICEGPTDTAAFIDMGFANVVGRPSCMGGTKHLVELVKQRQRPDLVIVADGDEPGRRGASSLASVLVAYAPTVRVIIPPTGLKDARDWLKKGGTKVDAEREIAFSPVRRLIVRSIVVKGSSQDDRRRVNPRTRTD